MNDDINKKALDDINLIKNVLNSTYLSLMSLQKIFVLIGISSLIVALDWLGMYIPVPMLSPGELLNWQTIFMVILSVIALLVFVATPLICINKIKKVKLNGLSKQLVVLWLFIIAINTTSYISLLIKQHSIDSSGSSTLANLIGIVATPIQLITFSIGLICLGMFAKLKFPIFLSIIYLISADIFLMFYVSNTLFSEVISVVITPVTLLSLGIYLRFIEKRVM